MQHREVVLDFYSKKLLRVLARILTKRGDTASKGSPSSLIE